MRAAGVGDHPADVATVPFDALTGLKAFVIANALSDIGAPRASCRVMATFCRAPPGRGTKSSSRSPALSA